MEYLEECAFMTKFSLLRTSLLTTQRVGMYLENPYQDLISAIVNFLYFLSI